ncbi:Rrf2 family transcriptional regulator [Paraglaciecola aquimarina]|uniref:Rrf2 family transcriptional regulator n=1 Tax=Paraglaciecola aquimarina TaxID=1235557 RepID=A0ABU3T0V3_9ALTE|nr:Rrf2 family transcriptional regulator [Paraglaciecola aquimarina]MDU0355897.1 Rrf2 family transcriptional regulator [Paraglaciecola aquimarina]
MQLTRYTDYGLRTLIYLALLPEGKKASIDEISQVYGISRNNLNKIVHQLGKANIIQTQRGKGGGFF